VLYGQNLADALKPGTTYRQVGEICEILAPALTEAKTVLISGAGAVADRALERAIQEQLSNMLSDQWAGIHAIGEVCWQEPDQDAPVNSEFLETVKGRVATSTSVLKLAAEWYDLPSWSGISDGIVAITGGIGATVGNAISKLLGNFIAGLWPYFLGAAVVLYLVYFRRRAS
jgi:hypothetical protein